MLGERRESAAEHAHRFVAHLGGVVHEVEQRPVVADDQQRTPPRRELLAQTPPGRAVEVVGRLVEEDDREAGEPEAGERRQHGLPARQRADRAVQPDGGQPDRVEHRSRPRLDVPRVAHGLEDRLGHLTLLDRTQGVENGAHTEKVRDRRVGRERDLLRQIADLAVGGDRAGLRAQSTADEAQQGGLPGAVGADDAGPARAERDGGVPQHRGAIGPGEADAVEHDRRSAGGVRM